jgi:hypothetical protein
MITAHRINGVSSFGFKVDKHQRGAPLHLVLKWSEMVTGWNHNQSVDAPRNKRRHQLIVANRITIGACGQHQVVVFAGNVFNPAQNRREKRIGDIDQEEPNDVAPQFRRSQRSGAIIGSITKLVDSGMNPNREVRADPGLTVDYPGYRFEADVGVRRNVVDRRSAVLSRSF